MRIAFVGKGGAGKSTLSTLFFLSLLKKNYNAICLDADLNIHVPKLLGIDLPSHKSLSLPKNSKIIKEYLMGDSERISTIDHFYKTTPPSKGVNFFELNPDNLIIKSFAEPVATGYVAAVGTYEEDEIGRSCYHTNLSILENILTFTKLKENDWIVTDMVAGIDAFSNTLHKQFDALFLVIEPTQESMSVYEQYKKLAEYAGISDRLFLIGNKIEDEFDEDFISKKVPADKYLGSLYKSSSLKKARQNNEPLTIEILNALDEVLLNKIEDISIDMKIGPNIRLQELHILHRKYIDQDYVKNAAGDLLGQIDTRFKF